MIKIDIQMPKCCMECPFYRGSYSRGSCTVSGYDLYFGNMWPDVDRYSGCPLEEVEE